MIEQKPHATCLATIRSQVSTLNTIEETKLDDTIPSSVFIRGMGCGICLPAWKLTLDPLGACKETCEKAHQL